MVQFFWGWCGWCRPSERFKHVLEIWGSYSKVPVLGCLAQAGCKVAARSFGAGQAKVEVSGWSWCRCKVHARFRRLGGGEAAARVLSSEVRFRNLRKKGAPRALGDTTCAMTGLLYRAVSEQGSGGFLKAPEGFEGGSGWGGGWIGLWCGSGSFRRGAVAVADARWFFETQPDNSIVFPLRDVPNEQEPEPKPRPPSSPGGAGVPWGSALGTCQVKSPFWGETRQCKKADMNACNGQLPIESNIVALKGAC